MSVDQQPQRLFVAVDMPEVARDAVRREVEVLAQTSADVRWASPDQLHVTLKFIGDTAPADVGGLRDALRAIPGPGAIALELRGLGRFPLPGKGVPRVLWAGFGGDVDRLVALASAVEDACSAQGVARERRPFSPHLTLGRVRSSQGLRPLETLVEERSAAFTVELPPVEAFRLYRSELHPTGVMHTVIEEFQTR